MPPSQTLEKPYESEHPRNKKKEGDSFKQGIRRIAANLHVYKNDFDSDIKIIRSKEGWRFKDKLLGELLREYEKAESARFELLRKQAETGKSQEGRWFGGLFKKKNKEEERLEKALSDKKVVVLSYLLLWDSVERLGNGKLTQEELPSLIKRLSHLTQRLSSSKIRWARTRLKKLAESMITLLRSFMATESKESTDTATAIKTSTPIATKLTPYWLTQARLRSCLKEIEENYGKATIGYLWWKKTHSELIEVEEETSEVLIDKRPLEEVRARIRRYENWWWIARVLVRPFTSYEKDRSLLAYYDSKTFLSNLIKKPATYKGQEGELQKQREAIERQAARVSNRSRLKPVLEHVLSIVEELPPFEEYVAGVKARKSRQTSPARKPSSLVTTVPLSSSTPTTSMATSTVSPSSTSSLAIVPSSQTDTPTSSVFSLSEGRVLFNEKELELDIEYEEFDKQGCELAIAYFEAINQQLPEELKELAKAHKGSREEFVQTHKAKLEAWQQSVNEKEEIKEKLAAWKKISNQIILIHTDRPIEGVRKNVQKDLAEEVIDERMTVKKYIEKFSESFDKFAVKEGPTSGGRVGVRDPHIYLDCLFEPGKYSEILATNKSTVNTQKNIIRVTQELKQITQEVRKKAEEAEMHRKAREKSEQEAEMSRKAREQSEQDTKRDLEEAEKERQATEKIDRQREKERQNDKKDEKKRALESKYQEVYIVSEFSHFDTKVISNNGMLIVLHESGFAKVCFVCKGELTKKDDKLLEVKVTLDKQVEELLLSVSPGNKVIKTPANKEIIDDFIWAATDLGYELYTQENTNQSNEIENTGSCQNESSSLDKTQEELVVQEQQGTQSSVSTASSPRQTVPGVPYSLPKDSPLLASNHQTPAVSNSNQPAVDYRDSSGELIVDIANNSPSSLTGTDSGISSLSTTVPSSKLSPTL